MNESTPYSSSWFDKQKGGAYTSAEIIAPLMIDLVSPRSVVDVGCGLGMWLSVFSEKGITDILGLDGSWIEKTQLHIPEEKFQTIDITKPFHIAKTADLAICLEVGEHIPDSVAGGLVKSLTAIAPVVLFSAAIPHQPGTNHVNGQWPAYWAAYFKKEGFVPVDCIRRKVWTNPKVEYWYAQNAIVYVKESALTGYPKLEKEIACGHGTALSLVHPERYRVAVKPPLSFFFRLKRKIRTLFTPSH